MPEQKSDAKSTVCGVKIQTWETHPGAGNGMLHFLDTTLFGGNVGHAAVAVTFPATAYGEELIKKYCTDPAIPYTKKKVSIPKAGKPGSQNSPAFEEEVYEVYFSWWPAGPNAGEKTHKLATNVAQDSTGERLGVDVEWDPKWKEIIQPEQRKIKGNLGSRVITLGVENIIHQREMSDEQLKEFEIYAKLESENNKMESLSKLIHDKLGKIEQDFNEGKSPKLSGGERLMLENLVPGWREKVKNPYAISKEEVIKLKEAAFAMVTERKAQKKQLFQQLMNVAPNNKFVTLVRIDNVGKIQENNKKLKKFLEDNKETGFKVTEDYKALIASVRDNLLDGTAQKDPLTEYINNSYNAETVDPKTALRFFYIMNAYVDVSTSLYETYIKRQNELYTDTEQRWQAHVVAGRSPDGVVSMPIDSHNFSGTQVGMPGGLEVEKMLAKMKELTAGNVEGFNLITKNCSKTVGAILEAGADNRPDLQKYLKNKAFGFFGNPQEVYNNSLKFQAEVLKGNKPPSGFAAITGAIRDFNPLERAGGAIIGVLMDENASTFKVIGATLASVVVGPLALARFLISKAISPLDTFKGLMSMGEYTFSRDSLFLKGMGMVSYALAGVFAIPAAIQAGVSKAYHAMFSPAPLTAVEFEAKEQEIAKESLDKLPVSEKRKLEQVNRQQKKLDRKVAVAIKEKMVEITTLDPKKAIEEFKTLLTNHAHAIPYVSKEAELKINEYLSKKDLKDKNPKELGKKEYEDLCNQSLKRVKTLETRLRAEFSTELKSKITQREKATHLSLGGRKVHEVQNTNIEASSKNLPVAPPTEMPTAMPVALPVAKPVVDPDPSTPKERGP